MIASRSKHVTPATALRMLGLLAPLFILVVAAPARGQTILNIGSSSDFYNAIQTINSNAGTRMSAPVRAVMVPPRDCDTASKNPWA